MSESSDDSFWLGVLILMLCLMGIVMKRKRDSDD